MANVDGKENIVYGGTNIASKIQPDSNVEETAETKLEPLRNAMNIPDGDWEKKREQVNTTETLISLQSVTEVKHKV